MGHLEYAGKLVKDTACERSRRRCMLCCHSTLQCCCTWHNHSNLLVSTPACCKEEPNQMYCSREGVLTCEHQVREPNGLMHLCCACPYNPQHGVHRQ